MRYAPILSQEKGRVTMERRVEEAFYEAYCRAAETKEASHVAPYLHPDLRFSGPLAKNEGKETYLKKLDEFLSLCKKISIRAKCYGPNQLMLVYEVEFSETLVCPTAAYVTFKDDLVSTIELFFDARPFVK
jgi:hypothetical protein